MSVIIVCLIISSVFLGIVAAVARSRIGTGGVCGLSVFGTMLFFVMMSPALFIQSFLTGVFAVVCLMGQKKPKTVFLSALAAMMISYGFCLYVSLPGYHHFRELREQHPIVSISGRLDYETRKIPQAVRADQAPPAIRLTEDVEKALKELEGPVETESFWAGTQREWALRELHEQRRDDFVLARGFGFVRMRGVHESDIELPPAEAVPLPPPPEYEPTSGSPISLAELASTPLPLAEQRELQLMHTAGTKSFLSPERFGYVQKKGFVAGFEPHGFAKAPNPTGESWKRDNWQMVRLELVSLLKHDTPMVYISKNLPSMDELKNARTRPLDLFEEQALPQIHSEKDVVISNEVNRIRMLGSLRAANGCLKCHSVERGELLGAFSYELIRTPSDQRPAAPIGKNNENGPQT